MFFLLLTLESLGSFLLQTPVAELHQQDKLNQKLWDGKQALLFFFYTSGSIVHQVENHCFNSFWVDSFPVPHGNCSKTSLLLQAPNSILDPFILGRWLLIFLLPCLLLSFSALPVSGKHVYPQTHSLSLCKPAAAYFCNCLTVLLSRSCSIHSPTREWTPQRQGVFVFSVSPKYTWQYTPPWGSGKKSQCP